MSTRAASNPRMTRSRFIYLHPPNCTRAYPGRARSFLNVPKRQADRYALSRGPSLFELGGNDLERDEPVVANDADLQLGADASLDHQSLQVARLGHRRAVHLDDQVSAAQ